MTPWRGVAPRHGRARPQFEPLDAAAPAVVGFYGILRNCLRFGNYHSHPLKAVEGWTDLGYGEFGLHYLRNKQKSEVDFLVSRDREPWFLVEAKTSDAAPTAALRDYQKAVGARHAFQVVLDAPFADFDCFVERAPVSVPALTFLSQLL